MNQATDKIVVRSPFRPAYKRDKLDDRPEYIYGPRPSTGDRANGILERMIKNRTPVYKDNIRGSEFIDLPYRANPDVPMNPRITSLLSYNNNSPRRAGGPPGYHKATATLVRPLGFDAPLKVSNI